MASPVEQFPYVLQSKVMDQENRMEISTLGYFAVKRGNKLFPDEASRSYRLWELFKFLLTFRSKGIVPEIILETLWPDQVYTDPKRASRNLVYRLRNVLSEELNVEDSYITFSSGCYKWNTRKDYWLDVDEFERLYQAASLNIKNEPVTAIKLFKKAIHLYRGDYLPECFYSEWVIPVRNYYRSLYLKSVYTLITLLESFGRYEEIIEVCEKSFLLEPLEEENHLFYIHALLETEKTRQALDHYSYITAVLFRETGIKPSPAMQNCYRMIKIRAGTA
jgi:two-component SAPR family response regulator